MVWLLRMLKPGNREVWSFVARFWYNKAADKSRTMEGFLASLFVFNYQICQAR